MFFSVLEVRTPVKILQTINILVRNKKEYSLLGTIKKTQVGNIHCPNTLESDRRIEVCCRNSIKRLRYFKVVLH